MARTYENLAPATLAYKINRMREIVREPKVAKKEKAAAEKEIKLLFAELKRQKFTNDKGGIDYGKIRASWDKKPAAKKAAAKKTAKKKAGRPKKVATA
jgi:DNA-binding transcriptional regulator YhcF (GntR family)